MRGHAAWALGRICAAEARAALSSRAAIEADADGREERESAIAPAAARAGRMRAFRTTVLIPAFAAALEPGDFLAASAGDQDAGGG
ncbi:MAG: hypothetical protein FIB01_03020 [Gemmatimonadetes bacterium]|nr:hypothetical protein [Gemmatimonadota bacterium]